MKYTHTIKKLPKSTTEITVDIDWSAIQSEYSTAFDKLHSDLTVEGFRKGKAPKAIAEKHIAKEKVYQELLNTLLGKIYQEILQKEDLKPIANPKIDLKKAKENENWEVVITIAEKPVVDLGDYKKNIQDAKAEMKKDDIWVPGKEENAASPEKTEEQKQKLLNTVLSTIMDKAKCEIPDMLVEEELEGRLTRLVDEVQKVGLTTESYLKSKNTTIDQLKEQYKKEIENTYKMEFILAELADRENIKVEQADLDKLFEGIKTEEEKKMAQQNAYFYASILRKQKTLDYLTSL